jgi:ribosomal protein S18 acetylase RimI-like enzyme
MRLSFRPAASADQVFARRIYIDTTRPYVSHLPDWTDDHLNARFERRFIVAATRMILRDGATIGWVRLSDSEGEIVLEQLYLDPACHRQGIGTAIMGILMRDWQSAGKSVSLRTLRRNPARFLYERFGFRIVDESEPNSYGMRLSSVTTQA